MKQMKFYDFFKAQEEKREVSKEIHCIIWG